MTFSRFWESDSLCVRFKVLQHTVSSNPGCVLPRFLVIFVVNACNSSPMRRVLVIPSVAPDRWLEDKILTFQGESISSGCHDAMLKSDSASLVLSHLKPNIDLMDTYYPTCVSEYIIPISFGCLGCKGGYTTRFLRVYYIPL